MGYTHGAIWDDKSIENAVFKVMKALNINRMPSKTEIELIMGGIPLVSAIGHRGGLYAWAGKLGLEVKISETQTGKGFEEVAIKLLQDKNYNAQRMTTRYPFDVLVNDKISVDVKVARAYMSRGNRCHTVGINKRYATCDLYLIFALDEAEKIERTFIIPGCDLKVTSMNFGRVSKYDKYINRRDLFKKYDNFYNNLASTEGQAIL